MGWKEPSFRIRRWPGVWADGDDCARQSAARARAAAKIVASKARRLRIADFMLGGRQTHTSPTTRCAGQPNVESGRRISSRLRFVLLQFAVERRLADAEQAGGSHFVSAGLSEGVEDGLLFHFRDRDDAVTRRGG